MQVCPVLQHLHTPAGWRWSENAFRDATLTPPTRKRCNGSHRMFRHWQRVLDRFACEPCLAALACTRFEFSIHGHSKLLSMNGKHTDKWTIIYAFKTTLAANFVAPGSIDSLLTSAQECARLFLSYNDRKLLRGTFDKDRCCNLLRRKSDVFEKETLQTAMAALNGVVGCRLHAFPILSGRQRTRVSLFGTANLRVEMLRQP